MGSIVAPSKLLVVGQLGLGLLKVLLSHNGGHLSHRNPLCGISQRMAAKAPPNGNQW
jgi:hypothetical protein